jgi:hypothetical protein
VAVKIGRPAYKKQSVSFRHDTEIFWLDEKNLYFQAAHRCFPGFCSIAKTNIPGTTLFNFIILIDIFVKIFYIQPRNAIDFHAIFFTENCNCITAQFEL